MLCIVVCSFREKLSQSIVVLERASDYPVEDSVFMYQPMEAGRWEEEVLVRVYI